MADAQHKIFAPEIGLNFSKLHAKYDDVTFNSPSKVGVRLGFLLDGQLSKALSFQTGLYLTQLGGKNAYYAGGYYGYQKEKIILNINYFQVPLTIVYKLHTKVPGIFFFGIGPYVGYAIGGKFKEGVTSVKLKFGDDKNESDVKPFDYGLDIRSGYESTFGLFAKIGYQFGFANLDPLAEGDEIACNRSLYLSIGYFLGKSTKRK
jgi:hypothetical protein